MLAQETFGLPVVVQFVSVIPAAVSVSPVPLPVAGVLRTNVVALVIDAMVEPALMLVPLMLMPGHSTAVLLQVTWVVPLVVQLVSTVAGV